MSFAIFKDVSTATLGGVEVAQMPSHKRAPMRYSEYYVKGRDGALHIDEGYSNYEVALTLVLIDGSAHTRQIVNAWASGSGKLILSDDPTKAYKASVKQEIQWDRQRGNKGFFDTAQIVFDCEPFMVEAQDTEIVLTGSSQISNPGTYEALPLLKIEGSGDVTFSINGSSVTITEMSSGQPVFLDCDAGYVYHNSGARTMTGDFPVLRTGINDIVFGSGITRMTITPHWRWL